MDGIDHSQCRGCGGHRRWFLHSIRQSGAQSRLCTNCVLNSNRDRFCPFCFQIYPDSLPHDRLVCLKCPSISHLSCIPLSHSRSPSSYLCPSCSTPNFSFFNLDLDGISMDINSARALAAAAEIAAASMTEAAALARTEAERRIKEAALAKKRAKEALERLVVVSAEEGDTAVGVKDSIQQHKETSNKNKRILADGKKRRNGMHSTSLVPMQNT